MPRYVRSNDLGTAVLLTELAQARFRGRLVLASSMVVYGEGRYRCAAPRPCRGPPPRAPRALRAGRFEPVCPHCERPLIPDAVTEDAAARSPQRLRRDEASSGAPLLRVLARDRRPGHRAALPQRLRAADAPRHAVRRRRSDLRERTRGRRTAPRCIEDGAQLRDFVHVRDVARANVIALTRAAAGRRSVQRRERQLRARSASSPAA